MKLPNKNEIRKPTKTLAGVTPIAVMLKPKKCAHGGCIYCPSLNVPQSYMPLSPPVIRARMLNYDPYKQVQARLKAFNLMNHPTNKIELIVMGGTFLEYPLRYQNYFIKRCFDALNNYTSKNIQEAKKRNEKAIHRCVALCLETRPDTCTPLEIKRMLKFGCTRVELGVQILDDKIYRRVNRGHTVKDVIQATQRLKDSGFKIGYHIMLGLPGSNEKKDLKLFNKIFKDEEFKPDQLKIYPCQVIKGSKLEKIHKQGKYSPYPEEKIKKLIVKLLKLVPEYCRVMRIMREIPPIFLVAGTKRIDLRKDIEKELRKGKTKIKEIRFREIGFNQKKQINKKLTLKKTEYKAGGKEFFLQFINKDNILFALLRARIPEKPFLDELKNSLIIRELHVYGKSIKIGEKGKTRQSTQHIGLGKKLMKEAEKIARKNNLEKIAVISGVGVREYYKKLGYKLEGEYMVKYL